MISKELFCDTLKKIREQDVKLKRFNQDLEEMCENWVAFDLDNKYRAALFSILEQLFNDSSEDCLIWAWVENEWDGKLYDKDDKLVVHIKSDEEFYDYMISEDRF